MCWSLSWSNSFSRSFIVYFTSNNALLVPRPPLRYSKVLVIIILFIFVLLAKIKVNCFVELHKWKIL